MKRDKPPKKVDTNMLAPLETMSKEPEDYANKNTGIILYGRVMAKKLNAKNEDGISELSMQQAQYLNMLSAGFTGVEACELLKMDKVMPMIWEEEEEKGSIYNQCLAVIKRMEADEAEQLMWRKIRKDPNAVTERLAGLAARKAEYKPNAQGQQQVLTAIHVQVGDRDFDVSANFQIPDQSSSSGDSVSSEIVDT
jgi:hypothetical protein